MLIGPLQKSPNCAVMISLHQFAVLGTVGEKGVRVKPHSLKRRTAKFSSPSSFSVSGEWRKVYLKNKSTPVTYQAWTEQQSLSG